MGYELTRFAENIEDFQCSICYEVLQDPLQIKTCEHMFCRLCVRAWMFQNLSCPVDRMPINPSELVATSRFFRNQYNRLKIKCKFNENGCEVVVKIEEIMNHEIDCLFNPYANDKECSELNALFGERMSVNDVSEGHKFLIESLKRKGILQSTKVENVMLAVDRKLFCVSNPYDDHAKKINYGGTISAPHMHALILKLLESHLTPNAKVLDIGSGSGYLTLCMALMLGGSGKVIGIDHVHQLVDQSTDKIRQHFSYESRIEFVTADGRRGYLPESPYDVINIGGAIDEVPQIILDQLKPNGRIVVPLSYGSGQKLVTIDKSTSGRISTRERGRVKFAFITDLESQLTRLT